MPRFALPSLAPATLGGVLFTVRVLQTGVLLGVLCCAGQAGAGDASTGSNADLAAQGSEPAASGGSDAARARALELFEQSSTSYDQGDFAGTVTLLEQAYAAFPEPVLLYNLGRAHEGLGDDAAAISAYERYLAAQAEAKDRGAILRRLQTLRQRVEERRSAMADAAPVAPPPASSTPIATPPPAAPRTIVPWVVTGVGGLGLASGGVLALLARGRHDVAQYDPDVVSAQQKQSQARDLSHAATVALIGGSLLTVAGVAWGIVTWTSSDSDTGTSPQIGLSVAPGAVWVSGRL